MLCKLTFNRFDKTETGSIAVSVVLERFKNSCISLLYVSPTHLSSGLAIVCKVFERSKRVRYQLNANLKLCIWKHTLLILGTHLNTLRQPATGIRLSIR